MELPGNVFNEDLIKVILSVPAKNGAYVRVDIARGENAKYQASMYTAKQVFHRNLSIGELKPFIEGLFGADFAQYTAFDGEFEYSAKVSRKGKILTSRRRAENRPKAENFTAGTFNRKKNHIIQEGDDIPALVDIGVFTKENKVAAQMRDKFVQINRFLELLADETGHISGETALNIIDFGCGKSYLTFLVHHYFTKIRKLKVNICGLDLNPDIVEKCAEAAEKYNCDSLFFKQGDIGGQEEPPIDSWGRPGTFNIVICLHACDTATDYAIFNAIKWKADLICVVPCCQHELREQMKPKNLRLFSEYGIIKERFASLATDAIRAKLLEHCGYKTQIIEFTGFENTPKNILIRARRVTGKRKGVSLDEIDKAADEFSFRPTLLRLLKTDCLPRLFLV